MCCLAYDLEVKVKGHGGPVRSKVKVKLSHNGLIFTLYCYPQSTGSDLLRGQVGCWPRRMILYIVHVRIFSAWVKMNTKIMCPDIVTFLYLYLFRHEWILLSSYHGCIHLAHL